MLMHKYNYKLSRNAAQQNVPKIHSKYCKPSKLQKKHTNPKQKPQINNSNPQKTGELHTFGDGALDFGALVNDVMVINAFLLLNKRLSEAVLRVRGRGGLLRRELDLGYKDPLDQRKGYADYGAHWNQDLRAEIWQNSRSTHGRRLCRKTELRRRGLKKVGKEMGEQRTKQEGDVCGGLHSSWR